MDIEKTIRLLDAGLISPEDAYSRLRADGVSMDMAAAVVADR